MPKKLSEQFIKDNCITRTVFSPCRKYRYVLTREWENGNGNVLFVMLNPSTADESTNDPTVDKCMKWAIKWGYNSFTVCNLFSYRETDRMKMIAHGQIGLDIVGKDNNIRIRDCAYESDKIIVGWGNEGTALGRDNYVLSCVLSGFELHAMKINKNGTPGHPLYLKNDSEPIPFVP